MFMKEDDYKGWVFLPSWEILLQGFPQEIAKELLWQIKEVGIGKDISTDNEMIRAIINGSIRPNIMKAQERYKSACSGGRPRNEDVTIDRIRFLQSNGWTIEQIANELNCSSSTIKNRIREAEK